MHRNKLIDWTTRSVGIALAAAGTLAWGQTDNYPSRAIRFVLPTAVGSGSDVLGRVIAHQMSINLGQPVVPDNRPGAAGVIGVTAVKNAPPDGYTIVFGNLSSVVNAPLLGDPPPYDPLKDFEPVALVYKSVIILAWNEPGAGNTLPELIEHARKNRGKLNYSSPGPGSYGHLWIEMMKHRLGIDMVHVPYKGAGPAFQAILTGEVQFSLAETAVAGAAAASSMRIIVQLGEQRAATLPNVPTVREAGYPEFISDFWFGALAPKGTPVRIVQRLNEEFNKVMATPEVRARVAAAGGEAIAVDPATFARQIAKDHAQWAPIVTQLGLKGK
jgi:tripartite-type tricarboxylate transporter receptor subunit TctC